MGKTTALELTLHELMGSGEAELMMGSVRETMGSGEVASVLLIGCRITQVTDLQQQFGGLGTVGTYHTLMNEKRYWRCGDDSPIQVTTIDSLHRYANFPLDRTFAVLEEARSSIGAICDPSKSEAEIDKSRITLSSIVRGAEYCVLMDNDTLYDDMCAHFMSRVDRDRQCTLLNFEHRSERMRRCFMLTALTKQWEEQVSTSIRAGINVFVACASQKAKPIAEFSERCKAPWKLYTGDKSCAKDRKKGRLLGY
jgi:hypothetical protein